MKDHAQDKLTAIEKTLEILVSFADNERELGTVELGELTSLHKATVSRILATLLDYGMVSQNRETKKYRLGPLAYRLGASQSSQSLRSFAALSQTFVDELRDALGEMISLEVWTGNKTVVCYLAESKSSAFPRMAPSDVLQLHAPAGAKAILAYVNDEQLERLLPKEFFLYTRNTIKTKGELLARLRVFNKQGYSVDNEELHEGVYAIGVPIFDHLSRPTAAISAVIPVLGVCPQREAEIVVALKRTSRLISKSIKDNRLLLPD